MLRNGADFLIGIMGTLSRIVAQQLAVPPAIREATNERN